MDRSIGVLEYKETTSKETKVWLSKQEVLKFINLFIKLNESFILKADESVRGFKMFAIKKAHW